MKYSYIKFENKTRSNANRDFDKVIDNVAEWVLEINNDDNKPNREIGIDKDGQTILIMPLLGNYGYWTDNDITDYFKKYFKAVDIDRNDFETRWNAFIQQNSFSGSYEFDKRGRSKYYRHLEENGWDYDGFMTFTKGNYRILFDTSECFYIERLDNKIQTEFQCKNMTHFTDVIKNNTE